MTTDSTKVCSLCEQPYEGYGNNPSPLTDRLGGFDRCCDDCNEELVVPVRARLMEIRELRKKAVPR